MRQLPVLLCALAVMAAPRTGSAQLAWHTAAEKVTTVESASTSPPALSIPRHLVVEASRSLTRRAARQDSLKNGAVIGAVVGGVGAALFAAYLCNAIGEEGDPPCWRGVLALGAIGAGVGVATGAAIDAAASRDSSHAGMKKGY